MGGINHQPCNRPKTQYLRFSTLMSRALSNARAQLELSNVRLEDILLREMGYPQGDGTVNSVLVGLNESCDSIRVLITEISNLRGNMKQNDYEDLHLVLGIKVADVVDGLAGRNLATPESLNSVAETMDAGGFYQMLDRLNTGAESLLELTAALVAKFDGLSSKEPDYRITAVLERNLSGNIKVEFANLYSAWNSFQELFLASSMVSTEIWYRYSQVGSLLVSPRAERALA